MKLEQILQMVIAGVIVALILEGLKGARGGGSVTSSAVWLNPATGQLEPLM